MGFARTVNGELYRRSHQIIVRPVLFRFNKHVRRVVREHLVQLAGPFPRIEVGLAALHTSVHALRGHVFVHVPGLKYIRTGIIHITIVIHLSCHLLPLPLPLAIVILRVECLLASNLQFQVVVVVDALEDEIDEEAA